MKRILAALIGLSLLAPAALAHGNNVHFESQQEITVKTTKVAGGVYMLQGRGGNIGALVGPEGILIVDDDYKNVGEKLREALKALGSEKPRYIFNTHWHGDHTEGNQVFGKESVIVAHRNVRQRLAQINTVFGRKTEPFPDFALPVITYTTELSIHFGGEEVRAVHFPNSHTDGDTVIFFTKSNVVHFGDTFFRGRFPFVDLENGGSVQGLTKTIETLIRDIPADSKLIPGHGPVSTLEDLKAYHAMLVETAKHVRDAMAKGKTLEEAKKEGLPEKYKEWGTGFIKTDFWIETIWKSGK